MLEVGVVEVLPSTEYSSECFHIAILGASLINRVVNCEKLATNIICKATV